MSSSDLEARLYYWITIANESRDRYGLPVGTIEELIYCVKETLSTDWLEAALVHDSSAVDPFGFTIHPVRRWLLSPFVDQHVIECLELGAYFKGFASDSCLSDKVRKLLYRPRFLRH